MSRSQPLLQRPARALAAVLLTALAVLATTVVTAVPAQAGKQEEYADWGRTAAPDQRFHKGCHGYKYRYRVKPPTEEWYLETFLRGPKGKKLAADLFHWNDDPRRGRAKFRVCAATTRPGKFTIRAKVVYRDGFDEHTARLEPSRFRISRR